jgi:hypothetical protein
LLPAKIRLELFFAIRCFSAARFQKFGRNARRDVCKMELGLISGSGKPPEVAQDALGRFSRIDDDESFQMFDRPRACGLLCSGMDLVSA